MKACDLQRLSAYEFPVSVKVSLSEVMLCHQENAEAYSSLAEWQM